MGDIWIFHKKSAILKTTWDFWKAEIMFIGNLKILYSSCCVHYDLIVSLFEMYFKCWNYSFLWWIFIIFLKVQTHQNNFRWYSFCFGGVSEKIWLIYWWTWILHNVGNHFPTELVYLLIGIEFYFWMIFFLKLSIYFIFGI